jgi:hypothetical protein
MSHAAHPSDFSAAHAGDHHAEPVADFSPANIDPPASARTLSLPLMVAGVVGIAVAAAGGFLVDGAARHALAVYHIGVMAALAMCLGATFWVMAFHLTQAGWSVTLRRQFENVMSLTPLVGLLVFPTLIIEALNNGLLFTWMNKGAANDPLYAVKAGFLNPVFFFVRAVIYVGFWAFLTRRLYWFSTEQDRTGDKWLTNRARLTSAWGMLVFALSVAFASFDWLMSMDYRFFSTMWGVYFFAGAAYSSIPLVVLLLVYSRGAGKLKGLVTAEHAHDLGKLMFGFTVFWAYIGFSQYFLIWYANIPEETQFMIVRKLGFWRGVAILLVVGHFILPFYIMLWLAVRRSFKLLAVMAVWAICMEVVDLWWIVRPFAYGNLLGEYYNQISEGFPPTVDPIRIPLIWIDLAGILGVLALFAGLIFWKTASGPLVPTRDPRLAEALHHRNYV